MGASRRALVVTPSMTYVDGVALPTPVDYAAEGLGPFLARVAARSGREVCVMLNGSSSRALGLPTARDELQGDMAHHPAAEQARAAGWKVSAVGDWTTLRAEGGSVVHLGVTTLLDPDAFPWYGESMADLSYHLGQWHERTGAAYHGNPGMAGLSILSNLYPRRGKGLHPTWKPMREVAGQRVAAGPLGAREDDLQVEHWRARRAGTLWAHSYDANRAYVAASIAVKVCPWELRRTGRGVEWRPDLAGWWQVELPAWTLRHMPDPAGYDPEGKGRAVRWVTGPTMGLLTQLAEEGVYGRFLVLDSWTGPAKEVLKPWGTAMRQAWDACPDCVQLKEQFAPDEKLCTVCRAVKNAGRATLGLMDRETNWLYRPDWYYAVIAMARSNLWRKMWKVGGGVNGAGPWPLWVDVDNVWYGSDIEDPREACPEGIAIGPKLGQFKPKSSRRRKARK